MTIKNEPAIRQIFPYEVTVHETIWIPLTDGTRLAARIWLPEDVVMKPVPAILEYVPYRRRDGTRMRDDPMHGWFSGHGYACIRVDIRGSGDSDGRLLDEYLLQEQNDALQVIDWIAKQEWCTGRIGMMGISWGSLPARPTTAITTTFTTWGAAYSEIISAGQRLSSAGSVHEHLIQTLLENVGERCGLSGSKIHHCC